MRSPCTTTKSSPHSPQLNKACTQQRSPNTAKMLEAEKSKIEVQVDEDPGQVAFWLAKDHFLAVSSYDTFLQDDLRNMGPVDARVYLEEMSWNEDDHSFSLSCRCGGKYSVSKDEAEEVTLISCDMCSLVIELLHYR
ncbi:dnaJ homolog subfamily C member 24 isoform X4 [Tursiops truncatus]|uniref:dnaJ homolog subfamily C member 24 isoform X4 n=1 Tax=Tursiops truncatus TaxID=9739 RepID=UPI003CCF01A3